MYGKLFESAYTGSMMGAGADVFSVWGYVIANVQGGTVELNPKHLSALIGESVERIEAAIEFLCQPDPYSRTPAEEGRRLIRDGQFQYLVVNHIKYRTIVSREDKREADRVRMEEKRKTNKNTVRGVEGCDSRKESQRVAGVAEVAHTEAEAEADTKAKNKNIVEQARRILDFLNEKTGKSFRPVKSNIRLIAARLKEGATEANCRGVIARKCMEWENDPKMRDYLRPATLFNATKFEQYLGQRSA